MKIHKPASLIPRLFRCKMSTETARHLFNFKKNRERQLSGVLGSKSNTISDVWERERCRDVTGNNKDASDGAVR